MERRPLYYWDYLRLDRLLGSQELESRGEPARDEMLFIVVHQAFELWFKQILWELDAILPASGFQSVQFRLIENRLGLRRRLKIKGSPYTSVMRPEHAALLGRSEREPALLDHVERWLERTPFLHLGDFDFWRAYRDAVDELLASGRRQLSHRAFLAALLITLYRDEPILQLPFRLLTGLVDIDEGLTAWRQRHALLAHRMIGAKIGTGGTSGHDYLDAAARKHRVFADLFDLPTFLPPRRALPKLPSRVAEQMSFRHRP